jgi:hypothetical protein
MEVLPHPHKMTILQGYLQDGMCCALSGLSNTGKSTLLRALCTPEASEGAAWRVYVDCNRMLDLSEQGFYEAVLRAVRAHFRPPAAPAPVTERLEHAYRQVVEPSNPFAIPLGFIEGIEGLYEGVSHPVVLVLDEFDEPFAALEGRTFLNLRALRDRYRPALVYVVGVERPLDELRDDAETAEFRELFADHTCRLGMLAEAWSAERVRQVAAVAGTTLSEEEVNFVVEQAGGHPGLLGAVTRLLLRARAVAPETYASMGTRLVAEALPGDEATRRECGRLWGQLTAAERAALQGLVEREPVGQAARERLTSLGLTDEQGHLFGAAFAAFIRRHGQRRADLPPGVWLDADSGEVYVDGRQAPPLTDLEYRLLRFLIERKDKLCDRFTLVEAVWGEKFIDEVDDARIEKLVSRLRAKIEQDPANPRYLLTVRGRGYRLQSNGQ